MGVKQSFKMDKFDWCITIYYTVDEDQKIEIMKYLKELECDEYGEYMECNWREDLTDACEDNELIDKRFLR